MILLLDASLKNKNSNFKWTKSWTTASYFDKYSIQKYNTINNQRLGNVGEDNAFLATWLIKDLGAHREKEFEYESMIRPPMESMLHSLFPLFWQ